MKQLYLLSFFLFSIALHAQNSSLAPKPFVLGQTIELESSQLKEKRIINIYLPEGYSNEDTTRYPVMYLLDGSANEDFVHICGIVQFFTMMQMMPPSIVVGIANVDRRRDFTFPTTIAKDKKDFPTTGGSQKFLGFIEKELQPFISKSYRTNSSKTLIGQSLGGLLATEIVFKKPDLFTQYIIVSPSLWWDKESLLAIKPIFSASPMDIYVAVGKEGPIMEGDAKNLVEVLQKNKNIKVSFGYFPDLNHATILHQAVYKALEVLNPPKKSK
ncbi:alpha/beta hydrolase-fold protein [Cytophagaceae bacterium DM2B3-1]|uniref:Alpha/beta hydrolase-fold protein n=1 Tax=Xanthocytophaga flava TaxID=3048013 RepID=A0ABT7CER7_9BACT|nr:alpha/beta hydrolase-fold protein [Xanthocytophaga flavus]MDJ1492242.1 alpha/beta hydrolase-fold protein [Xanthocytophaga flavus]